MSIISFLRKHGSPVCLATSTLWRKLVSLGELLSCGPLPRHLSRFGGDKAKAAIGRWKEILASKTNWGLQTSAVDEESRRRKTLNLEIGSREVVGGGWRSEGQGLSAAGEEGWRSHFGYRPFSRCRFTSLELCKWIVQCSVWYFMIVRVLLYIYIYI